MNRWSVVAFAYLLLAVAATAMATVWRMHSIVSLEHPWLPLDDALSAHLFSGLLGLCFGAVVVLLTKPLILKFDFAARLHSELRPLALSLSTQMVAVLATTSAIGEELTFRGLLLPWIGLVPQAVLFGFLHQTNGSSRWVWMAWATLMGLLLGAMYQLSGSVVGPIVAHCIINWLNLLFLQRHDPRRGRRALGGLLGQRDPYATKSG